MSEELLLHHPFGSGYEKSHFGLPKSLLLSSVFILSTMLAKLVHTRRAFSCTITNLAPPDPHYYYTIIL